MVPTKYLHVCLPMIYLYPSGAENLLTDSGIYAGGTVDLFLQGKEYSRAVRALILAYMYEAMS